MNTAQHRRDTDSRRGRVFSRWDTSSSGDGGVWLVGV